MFENHFVALLTAFLVCFVAMKALSPVAIKLRLVDKPGGRKCHEFPTPLTGGLAMLAGILAAFLFTRNVSPQILPFSIAAILLVSIGMVDDRYDIRWYIRMLIQCVAVLVMIFSAGLTVQDLGFTWGGQVALLGVLAVPFTLVASVGLINAINMTDGVDGLAGCVSLTSLLMFVMAASQLGHVSALSHLLPIVGALAAFLWFNMRFPWQQRARAFMGDAGSMLLGLTLAWVAIHLTQGKSPAISPVLAPWFLAPPIIDCLTVIVRRLKVGRSPFAPDRDHLHHLLLDAGYSPAEVSLSVSAATLFAGAGAALALKLGAPEVALVLGFVICLVSYFWITARRARAVAVFQALRFWRGATAEKRTPGGYEAIDVKGEG